MATPGEGIHVVQGPHHWQSWRKLAKKIAVIEESGDPVKIQDICLWQLPQHVCTVLAPVFAEESGSCGARPYLPLTPFQLSPFQSAAQASRNVPRRRKLQNSRVGRRFIKRKEPRLVASRAQPSMQPISRSGGSASEIPRAYVGDLHARVASMKSESGL